jgi:outer membrane protein assembly factor BamC
MKTLWTGFLATALVCLAGCNTLASDGKRVDYRGAAPGVPAIEIPPDLTIPVADDRYKMPGDSGTVATYSEYSKAAGSKASTSRATLPDFPNVHLERNGAQRWLVINRRAEDVWPVVKEFWEDNGLKIKSEDPSAGVMETDWAENLAKLPVPAPKSAGSEAVNFGSYPIGERDQYVTRLERIKDGNSTEVHITQRGLAQVIPSGKTVAEWQPRGNDPEKEAIMLQRLMVRFGSSEDRAADELAVNRSVTAVPSATVPAPQVASQPSIAAPELPGTASLREIASGRTIIAINDTFDRAWRKVGLAIDSAGLGVEDKDREKGVYYLRPIKLETTWVDKLMFWKSNVDTSRHYRVYVKDGGASCEVSIADQNGASSKASNEMLDEIFKYISKP